MRARGSAALLRVGIARVDVGALGERGVVAPGSLTGSSSSDLHMIFIPSPHICRLLGKEAPSGTASSSYGGRHEYLRRRVAATNWPEKETVGDQSQGVPLAMIQELASPFGTAHRLGLAKEVLPN